jgi:hypothetical protein
VKQKLFFILFLLLTWGAAYSQTFYEFNYHYGEKIPENEFKALVLRNPDGTGIMRIVFTEEDKKNIVEVNIEEHYLDDDKGGVDSNSIVLIGMDVKYIVGDAGFSADHFIFTKNDEGFFEPAGVFTIEDTATVEGEFDDVRLINQSDMTEDFVLQFFTKDEDFYKDLFETETRNLSLQEKQTRLHLLLIANTNDKKIGKTCEVDLKNTFDTYKEISEFLGIQMVSKVISGNEFSKVNVDKALNAIRPSANDIVVFYYTGHGFNEERGSYRFPYLDLRDKSYQEYGGQYTMNMEAIFQKIKIKGARFNLVMSDCCNNDPSQSQIMTAEDPATKVSSIGWDKNKCIALFLNPKRQSILATAVQKGELSAGNVSEGGFYTSNFLQSLEKHIGKVRTTKDPLEANWNSIISIATKETTSRAARKWCRMLDESVRACNMNPISRME